MTEYTNPRRQAIIPDWPSGRHRTTATFQIESNGKGERALRTTLDKTGRPNAPKMLSYSRKARIVDGDDNRTYIIELTMYGFIKVMQSDMQHQQETVFDKDPRYAGLLALFEEGA